MSNVSRSKDVGPSGTGTSYDGCASVLAISGKGALQLQLTPEHHAPVGNS